MGTRLFDHLPDGYALTPAGENLYQNALVREEQAQAIDRQVFGLDAQLKGSLVLTASHDVFSRLVIRRLGIFRKAYPGIRLQLLSTTGLGARQADIALRLTPKPPDYLIGRKVLPLGMGIYASGQYLEQNPQPAHLVLWNDEIEMPAWATQNFPQAEVTIRANDVTTLLACLNNHMGISMLPCYIGGSASELYRLDLPLEASNWSLWVLSHVDLRATARVRACREFLADIIEQQETLIAGLNSRYWPGSQ
ncbi:MAG: LysR family transcriptional regulator [Gammaproteobacteria bacterium]|nr:LysR family transcriptional regulator [Gammaproteobacteria bacterium]